MGREEKMRRATTLLVVVAMSVACGDGAVTVSEDLGGVDAGDRMAPEEVEDHSGVAPELMDEDGTTDGWNFGEVTADVCGDACGPEPGAAGYPCTGAADCDSGYHCGDGKDVAGGVATQCMLSLGECECKQWHIDQGAWTECFSANEAGNCPGDRQCMADGLTPCSAPEPEIDECNGQDDDCDGATDNGCTISSCKDFLDDNPNADSGLYTLDSDGAGGVAPFDVYCDMDTNGGGWTLISSTGDVGGVNSYQYFPHEAKVIVGPGYTVVTDGDNPSFAIGSNNGGGDKLVYFEIDTLFTFTEVRGSWRGYGGSGIHHDDNWNAGSWGKTGSGANGYVMFGTPATILKSGGQWGGDWNNGSTTKYFTFNTQVAASIILRWAVEDQSSPEYVLFNNLEILVR